jgi:hypothetical protein
MYFKKVVSLILLGFISLSAHVYAQQNGGSNGQSQQNGSSEKAVDNNERLHLVFMREEEKLARDVYTTLGMRYPQLAIFGNISKQEEQHTSSVYDKLTKYSLLDPVTNDNVGVFSGEEFGFYFTEKYQELTDRGSADELAALYVGAFIEELDMLDIMYCPKIIVETIDTIENNEQCGLVYTDNEDIKRLYTSLMDGSKSHLRAFTKQIEARQGEGTYEAQILSQEEVDEILGR